nr:hypothetical protein [Stygiolobus azoricus]
MWLDTAPNAKIYVSHLWERFTPHLGVDPRNRIIDLPDESMDIGFGSFKIKTIPAHFMQSSGNFHLARFYFSE